MPSPSADPATAANVAAIAASAPVNAANVNEPGAVLEELETVRHEIQEIPEMMKQNEYTKCFETCCDLAARIPKDSGSADPENDPFVVLIKTLLTSASPAFWEASKPKELIVQLLKRIREGFVEHIRKNGPDSDENDEKLVLPLSLVKLLNPASECLLDAKFVSPIKFLRQIRGNVGTVADELAQQYPAIFVSDNLPEQQQSPQQQSPQPQEPTQPAPVQPKRSNLKRPRSPGTSDELDNSSSSSNSSTRATRKSVHWESPQNLVKVRYFEVEGGIKFKSKRSRLADPEDEVREYIWSEPKSIEFSKCLDPQLIALTPIKRGGDKLPDDTELSPKVPESASFADSNEFAEPPESEQRGADAVSTGVPFKAATPHPEWVKKVGPVAAGVSKPLNAVNMAPMPMAPMNPMGMHALGMPMGFMNPMNPMGAPMGAPMNPMNMNMNMNMNINPMAAMAPMNMGMNPMNMNMNSMNIPMNMNPMNINNLALNKSDTN